MTIVGPQREIEVRPLAEPVAPEREILVEPLRESPPIKEPEPERRRPAKPEPEKVPA